MYNKKKTQKTITIKEMFLRCLNIVLNIVALVIALANSTLGILNNLGVINLY